MVEWRARRLVSCACATVDQEAIFFGMRDDNNQFT